MQFITDIANDSFSKLGNNNGFEVFKSIDNKIYLIYSNNNRAIISYDLINKKKLTEIKSAHNKNITNFRYILDNINKRDLVISVSAEDNNIKLWNINIWECLYNIVNIYKYGLIYSACFLNFNNNIYIVTSNYLFNKGAEPIKIFDLNGKKIKELKDSKGRGENTHFIDTFNKRNSSKAYIIASKERFIKIYDYKENKVYNSIYVDYCSNIIINEKNENINLITPCADGFVRIWDFDSAKLLIKIKISNIGLSEACLSNKGYLFVAIADNSIKMIDLNKRKIITSLIGHNNIVRTIKTINIQGYGECVISQGQDSDKIKLWIFKIK